MAKKKKEILFMERVTRDINAMKFTPETTLHQIEKKFHRIMRKHGIKHGTKNSNGSVSVSNAAWVICQQLMLSNIPYYFTLERMFDTPKDLQC